MAEQSGEAALRRPGKPQHPRPISLKRRLAALELVNMNRQMTCQELVQRRCTRRRIGQRNGEHTNLHISNLRIVLLFAGQEI